MPLYECRCERCELTFEVLAPLSASGMRSRPCPDCGRQARRIISAVAFTVEGGTRASSLPEVTQLKVPPPARLCWMDDRSAARYAAYKHGRGAEYDDKVQARDDAQKKSGEPPALKPAVAAAHHHGHPHHGHAHPRAAPAAARGRKPAQSKRVKPD